MTTAKTATTAAATAAKQETAKGAPVPVDYTKFVAFGQANFNALVDASDAFFKGMTALNREIVDFADKRLQASLETSQAIMRTQNPAEILGVQVGFVNSATQQYLAEATTLLKLAADMTRESWSSFQAHAKAVDPLATKATKE